MILSPAMLTGLYAITDASLMPGEQLFAKAEAALRGGVRLLQYRNKNALPAQQREEAKILRALCTQHGALFIVNDDVVLAQAVGADGVHLGQSDAPLSEVRQRVGEAMLVGISCHASLPSALQAQQGGASYVAFGRFFASHTKPDAPPAELAVLAQARQQLDLPVVAIGGITRDNAPRVLAQGADMVAVINELFAPDDLDEITARARTFLNFFQQQPHEQVRSII